MMPRQKKWKTETRCYGISRRGLQHPSPFPIPRLSLTLLDIHSPARNNSKAWASGGTICGILSLPSEQTPGLPAGFPTPARPPCSLNPFGALTVAHVITSETTTRVQACSPSDTGGSILGQLRQALIYHMVSGHVKRTHTHTKEVLRQKTWWGKGQRFTQVGFFPTLLSPSC